MYNQRLKGAEMISNLFGVECSVECNIDLDNLCNLYNQQMETKGELEQAWNEHANERMQWQRLNECLEILKKKIADLKK